MKKSRNEEIPHLAVRVVGQFKPSWQEQIGYKLHRVRLLNNSQVVLQGYCVQVCVGTSIEDILIYSDYLLLPGYDWALDL